MIFLPIFICSVDPANRQVTDFTNVTNELTILNNISCKCIHENNRYSWGLLHAARCVCVCVIYIRREKRFFHLDPQQWLQVSNIPALLPLHAVFPQAAATHSCYTLYNSVFEHVRLPCCRPTWKRCPLKGIWAPNIVKTSVRLIKGNII